MPENGKPKSGSARSLTRLDNVVHITHLVMRSMMFHNFTFLEIKNARDLIRSDLGHNEEIKFFFRLLVVLRVSCPPKFDIFGRGKNFLRSAISPKQNRIEE